MLQLIAELIESFPGIFDWVLAPATLVLLLLAINRKARTAATWGFIAVAVVSVSLLSIGMAALFYAGWRYGGVAFGLLLNLGPKATLDFLSTVLRGGVGVRPIALLPMLATASVSSIAAVILSGRRS